MAEEKTKEKSDDKKENQKQPKTTTVWEWLIAAAGFMLVVGVIGSTIYRATTEKTTPPKLEIGIDSIVPTASGYLVKFRVKNTGNQTAAAVAIEGELKSGTESAETSDATLNYAPANSERHGGLFFTKNPQQFDLQIRATGYQEP
jgi:uncharacterized protein (TIGR02588 family)